MTAGNVRARLGRAGRVAILTPIALTACAGDRSSGDGADRPSVDTTGVPIIEVSAEAWTRESGWRLAEPPLLTIGELDGAVEYSFSGVTDALLLDDGTLVATDNGSKQVRFYSSTGAHLRSVGRQGEGPGEFMGLGSLTRLGADSLAAWDRELCRTTVLGIDGAFGRTMSLRNVACWMYALEGMDDRSLVGDLGGGVRPEQESPGVHWGRSALVRIVEDDRVDTIAVLSTNPYLVRHRNGVSGVSAMILAPAAVHAIAPDAIYYSDTFTYDIHRYAPDGRLDRVIRPLVDPPPLTRARVNDLVPPSNPDLRRAYDDQATLPTYSDLMIDAAGHVWAADFELDRDAPRRWTIVHSSGRPIGRLVTPANLTIYEIGEDYLLGKTRDELGVERIVLYELIK